MLTPEQIKNLKKGDPIVIHARFDFVDSIGDVWFRAPAVNDSNNKDYISSDYVFLPTDSQSSTVNSQSKYDPTRPFKKGDIVKRRTVDGRTDTGVPEGINLTVTGGEISNCTVKLRMPDGGWIVTNVLFLELVTPVEELEPSEVEYDDHDMKYRVTWRDKFVCDYPCDSRSFYTKEQAKAAAEAERDRLNAEYNRKRKEQK